MCSCSILLYVRRDRKDYSGREAQDGHLGSHTAPELSLIHAAHAHISTKYTVTPMRVCTQPHDRQGQGQPQYYTDVINLSILGPQKRSTLFLCNLFLPVHRIIGPTVDVNTKEERARVSRPKSHQKGLIV